jgi:hypothetical protein
MRRIALLLGLLTVSVGVHGGARGDATEPLASPAGTSSGMYNLATGGDGRVYLSWIDPAETGGHALRFSRLGERGWEPARDVVRGTGWFVNWADHPSVTAVSSGRLFAHWLEHTGAKTGVYGYAIHVRTSTDGGRTWADTFDEGTRNVKDYSGFLTFLPARDQVHAAFLTPLAPDDHPMPDAHEHDHVKTFGIVTLGPDGRPRSREIVDSSTCSCCSTDMTMTSAGPVAVYRDRDAGEVRDISIVRSVRGTWTAPAPVHRDGWVIKGCPTNGPAVAAAGARVAVTWFTGARNQPAVHVAFSEDAGATFGRPIRVDDGTPTGWPDVVMLPSGRTLISWLERTATGEGEIRMREVTATSRGPAIRVAVADAGRATGIPMMTVSPRGIVVAWRKGGVQTALVRPAAVPRP